MKRATKKTIIAGSIVLGYAIMLTFFSFSGVSDTAWYFLWGGFLVAMALSLWVYNKK